MTQLTFKRQRDAQTLGGHAAAIDDRKINDRAIDMLQTIEHMATDRMTIRRNTIGFKLTHSDSYVGTFSRVTIHEFGFMV